MSSRPSALRTAFLATALTAGLATGASAQLRSCVDTLTAMPEFSRITSAIVRTHLVDDLRNANEITIFAPTNEAVSRLNQVFVERLFPTEEGERRADPVLAPAAVGAHIVQGRRNAASMSQAGQLRSMAGTPLNATTSGGVTTVTGAGGVQAHVTRADIACSNGFIHAIDGVLLR
ncbi:fasciclin domain-containing protein [Falsiroseomonas sp. HC035]|uniref:fasciclin domain-containing protein n=1 Tax=Falsiroseomonas sp. HC035 TaxID=3390999 RepID=UPI003D32372D